MHRFVCDLDSVWDQADGEPQRVAGAARGAGGDLVLQVVLQGRVRTVHRVGVGEPVAGGFREAARVARGEGLARQSRLPLDSVAKVVQTIELTERRC